jgi:hypothetical protein
MQLAVHPIQLPQEHHSGTEGQCSALKAPPISHLPATTVAALITVNVEMNVVAHLCPLVVINVHVLPAARRHRLGQLLPSLCLSL